MVASIYFVDGRPLESGHERRSFRDNGLTISLFEGERLVDTIPGSKPDVAREWASGRLWTYEIRRRCYPRDGKGLSRREQDEIDRAAAWEE